MPGTRKGALKATKTKRDRYGRDYFSQLGKKGGNPVLLAIRDANKQESHLPAT